MVFQSRRLRSRLRPRLRPNLRLRNPRRQPQPALPDPVYREQAVYIGNVLDVPDAPDAPEAPNSPEVGLTMEHKLDPKAQAAIEHIGKTIERAQQRGPWLVAAAGVLVGLGVGALWWSSTGVKKSRKAKKAKRR